MSYTPYRWAVPPLPGRLTRRERRWQAAAERQARAEIRWIWSEVCSGALLTRRIVPTGTASWEPPRFGRVVLGPPTTFTVELRPGQLVDDLLEIDRRLAAAYQVDGVDIRPLVANWVRIELVEHRGARPGRSLRAPARPGPSTAPLAPDADPLPERRYRDHRELGSGGSAGGPRSTRRWPHH